MFQTDFSPVELATRRQRVLDAIGSGAVALIQGSEKEGTHGLFRQNNDFYYLCAVEVPHAYLLLNGSSGESLLFLPHQSAQSVSGEGEMLSADNAETVSQLTGLGQVHGIEHLAQYLERAEVIYAPLRMGEGAAMSWDTLQRGQQEIISDPWDGRPDRMRRLVSLLRERYPGAEIRNLSPTLDGLRLIKSEQEIALLRRAGKLCALGVEEAMRSTQPGIWEHQLDAVMRYVYLVNGARDAGYRAIIAGGDNMHFGHYKANNAQLVDGEAVLVDCAPDYHYYTSDIGRIWPVNGRYSDVQRELYGFMVQYHKTLLDLVRPHVTPEQVMDEAAESMRAVLGRSSFSKDIYQQAAARTLEWRGHMSHPVGMAVHDVGRYREKPLQPGVVFALDPSLWVPEEQLYYRVEDTLVITQDGYENLTADAPLELQDVEAMVQQEGMLQRFPALW
jgi:Xaa-Pro aminopeptidase